MKYFIDTEFLEGSQKENFPISLFRKNTPNTIDLISIGIVAEDGREYYAISKDFNLKEAWNRFDLKHDLGSEPRKVYWIRENVLKPIFVDLFIKDNGLNKEALEVHLDFIGAKMDYYWLKTLLNKYGKTNKQISREIVSFTTKAVFKEDENGKYLMGSDLNDKTTKGNLEFEKPEFYAYYADYDWVVFCWLFGKMINLPKGFPMYCKDLKQEVDYHLYKDTQGIFDSNTIKNHPSYPKQENNHNALCDAHWNKKFYEFLHKF